MRMLAVKELDLVTGGSLPEVVSTAPRPRPGENPLDPYGTGFDASDIYGDEGGNGGSDVRDEVVVEAPKMTEQEKFAYDLAKARAEASLTLMELVGVTALVRLGGKSAVAAGWVAYGEARVYTDEAREKLLEVMTENEFRLDGMDGRYDGNVEYRDSYR
jgi:hypothetical protein